MKILFFLLLLLSFSLHATTIKIGVLAPEGTSWANNLKEMSEDISKKTSGRIQFKIYYGGAQGDEGDVLKKIRIGQLHGSFFTGKTLGEIFSDSRVMEIPFTFGNNYKKAITALGNVEKNVAVGFEKQKLKCLGLFGMGFVYFISQKKFTDLESLKGMKIWTWDGDKITTTMVDELHLTGVSLALPDVISSLSTGMLNATYAPPLGIVALQWNSKVKYLLDFPLAYSVGAFLIDQREWAKLTPQDQNLLQDSAKTTLMKITNDNEKENQEALNSMKKMGMEFIRFPEKDLKTISEIRTKVVSKLKGTFFSPQSLKYIEVK